MRKLDEKAEIQLKALIEASDAYKLFEGVVSGVKRESKLGFLWGESSFKGQAYARNAHPKRGMSAAYIKSFSYHHAKENLMSQLLKLLQ